MVVTKEDLEQHLEALRQEVREPRLGLYGPHTLSWKIGRESIVFLGGGRAALLQLSHPFVAHAIEQHSRTKIDLVGRFQRTFSNVYSMIFGDLDHALRSARRVHAFHATVHGTITEDVGIFRNGTRYHANDEDALLWVHATLVDTAMLVFDRCVRRLSDDEKDRYWRESFRFARLFGISKHVLPPRYPDFRRYFDGMLASDVIVAGRPAREMAGFLLRAPTQLHVPAMHAYRLITASLLPERLRVQLGIPITENEERIARALIRAFGAAYRVLPRRLRYVPAYVEAMSRIQENRESEDRVGRAIEKLVLRWLAPPRKVSPTV